MGILDFGFGIGDFGLGTSPLNPLSEERGLGDERN